MILLQSLSSESGLLSPVKFRKGLNIVLGQYRQGKGANAVGKSTLVRLVDLAFLSTEARKHFSAEKLPFLSGHSIEMDFTIDGRPFRIQRNFDSPSLVRFGPRDESLNEFTETELRPILGSKFLGSRDYDGIVENNWFRTIMRFFIKDDINYHERTNPINFVRPGCRQSTLWLYNFYLLGLPNRDVCEFDKIERETADLRRNRATLEKKILSDTGKSVDQIRLEVVGSQRRVAALEASLGDFEFLENYKRIEKRLVELSGSISDRLKQISILERQLEKYRQSHRFVLEVDLNRVRRIYAELSTTFAEHLRHKLDEVVEFRREIADNRKRFLAEKEASLESSIQRRLQEISSLEVERSLLYRQLEEKKALDSIKGAYEELVKEKSRLLRIEQFASTLQEIERSIADSETKTSETISNILDAVGSSESVIAKLISQFDELLKTALLSGGDTTGASFDIRATSDRKKPVVIAVNVPKTLSLGKSRFRILAYDLTVFLNIVATRRQLPHFLIHDGVFHGIDVKTKVNVLNYIYRKSLVEPDFQYIMTANEEEIETPAGKEEAYGTYQFDWHERVIAEYGDTPEKRIFKREF